MRKNTALVLVLLFAGFVAGGTVDLLIQLSAQEQPVPQNISINSTLNNAQVGDTKFVGSDSTLQNHCDSPLFTTDANTLSVKLKVNSLDLTACNWFVLLDSNQQTITSPTNYDFVVSSAGQKLCLKTVVNGEGVCRINWDLNQHRA
jgi:hypothetical protein